MTKKKTKKQFINGKEGIALVIALIIVAIVAAISVTSMMVSRTGRQVIQNIKKDKQLHYVTAAGIYGTMAELGNQSQLCKHRSGNILSRQYG